MLSVGLSTTAYATAPLPPDIEQFLDRFTQCEHWAGEEPYDSVRSDEIAAAMTQLRCDHLQAQEQMLRKRYQHNEVVLEALRTRETQP